MSYIEDQSQKNDPPKLTVRLFNSIRIRLTERFSGGQGHMKIGIDASRAFVGQPTGTENYSYRLIKALARIDRKNMYTLYVRNFQLSTLNFQLPENFRFKVIPFRYLFTQLGLAVECLLNPPDVLFVPAHTMPIVRRPTLKTVVTIHDLGSEFLPQHHQFPQKLYLNWSTVFAVKQAAKIIAVSKSTKKDLIKKLHCDPKKITVVYEACLPVDRAYKISN